MGHSIGYYYRYDTYLISKGYIREYLAMVYKTDAQQGKILYAARKKAETLQNSKLYKALK